MKRIKLFAVAATLMLASASLFAFKSNAKFSAISALFVNGVQVASDANGHWFNDNQGGAAFSAELRYSSVNHPILDAASGNQAFFKP
jgi:hypothetical protein